MVKTDYTNLFSLNVSSGIPIYRQLIDQIRQAIRMGLLCTNEQLPSVRVLAKALQINPMTISKAFAQLEIEGVLIRKRGIGMLVAEPQESQKMTKYTEESLKTFIKNARIDKLKDDEIATMLQQYLSLNHKEKKNE